MFSGKLSDFQVASTTCTAPEAHEGRRPVYVVRSSSSGPARSRRFVVRSSSSSAFRGKSIRPRPAPAPPGPGPDEVNEPVFGFHYSRLPGFLIQGLGSRGLLGLQAGGTCTPCYWQKLVLQYCTVQPEKAVKLLLHWVQ